MSSRPRRGASKHARRHRPKQPVGRAGSSLMPVAGVGAEGMGVEARAMRLGVAVPLPVGQVEADFVLYVLLSLVSLVHHLPLHLVHPLLPPPLPLPPTSTTVHLRKQKQVNHLHPHLHKMYLLYSSSIFLTNYGRLITP
jgi:hypothetical protein